MLTSRILILTLHFCLESMSLVTQSPLSLEGNLLTFRSNTFHSWISFQCLWGPNSSYKGSQRDTPTKNYPESKSKHWKVLEPLFSPKVQKMCNCFFPSTPRVLYFLFLSFHFLRQSLRRDFTKMSSCTAIWKIPTQWEKSGAIPFACMTSLIDSIFLGKY